MNIIFAIVLADSECISLDVQRPTNYQLKEFLGCTLRMSLRVRNHPIPPLLTSKKEVAARRPATMTAIPSTAGGPHLLSAKQTGTVKRTCMGLLLLLV